jgi:hypothetical protein
MRSQGGLQSLSAPPARPEKNDSHLAVRVEDWTKFQKNRRGEVEGAEAEQPGRRETR